MPTYNTGNPVPSAAPKDLYDNAQALDEALNGQTDFFVDRLGNSRMTLFRALQLGMSNYRIYSSQAAGLAATTDGDYFAVPATLSTEYLVLFRNESGVAVEKKRLPSAQLIAALEGRIGTAESDIDALGMMATALESRATTLEGRATMLEGRATSAENSITGLDGRADTAETDIISLKQRATSLEARTTLAEGDINALEERLDDMAGLVAAAGMAAGSAEQSAGEALAKATEAAEDAAAAQASAQAAQGAADSAVAVVTGGTASLTPAPGKIPIADGDAVIDPSWVGFDGGTVRDVLDNAKTLADYGALRAYTGRATGIRLTKSGLAGHFYLDDADTTSADNGGTIIVDGSGRRRKRVFSGSVDVRWFGAVADGVKNVTTGAITGTENTAAFAAALNYLATIGGGRLYVPKGKYAFTNNTGAGLIIKSDIEIVGDGMYMSELLFNDSASTNRRDLLKTEAGATFNVTLRDIGFVGDWGSNNDWTQRSHLGSLDTAGDVTVERCRFSYSRFFALSIGYTQAVKSALVSGCELFRICADGISVRNCDNTVITGNYINGVNDDGIACHTRDIEPSPVQNRVVVSDNMLVDSQGIRVQGVKDCAITGNTVTRAHNHGISVTNSAGVEGNTAPLSIIVTNNVIDTVFDGSYFSALTGAGVRYINISNPVPSAVDGYYVGEPNGSGGIVSPYPYFYINNVDASPPAIGGWFIRVAGNVCTRTLGPVTNYSDYGFGQRYGRSGPVNPAITDVILGVAWTGLGQIELVNSGNHCLISDNICYGGSYGIVLRGTSGSAYLSWRDVMVQGNNIANFQVDGILSQGEGFVEIKNNLIDGDPLHVHPYRAANGKWTFPAGNETRNAAVRVVGGNATFTGNSVKNVQAVVGVVALSDVVFSDNTFFFNPNTNSSGFDTNNIGIGYYGNAIDRGAYNIVILDGDPSSSTYGKVLNTCLNSAGAMPSAGKYVEGHFVINRGTAVQGSAGSQYVVFGWKRVTTGTGHVLNSDWRELRCLTGT